MDAGTLDWYLGGILLSWQTILSVLSLRRPGPWSLSPMLQSPRRFFLFCFIPEWGSLGLILFFTYHALLAEGWLFFLAAITAIFGWSLLSKFFPFPIKIIFGNGIFPLLGFLGSLLIALVA